MLDRRTFLKTGLTMAGLSFPSGAQSAFSPSLVQDHDAAVVKLLERQVMDRGSPWFGGYPNADGLVTPHSAAHLFEMLVSAYLCPQSRYHQDGQIKRRIRHAVQHLETVQRASGNIDLPTTNFNSPPDTGFVLRPLAGAATLAKGFKSLEILEWITPFLKKAGMALSRGGIHTPNHRWVVCSALAQLAALYPDEPYIERIDQWLQEGVDIDVDGMYTERSTRVYNAVTNRSLVTMADKLNRPELLDPVRRNLDAMQYLLHANGEVVTEISRRQDAHTRGDLRRYWFALRYMAIHDHSGPYAAMLLPYEPAHIQLPRLMEYPILNQPLPQPEELPSRFEKHFSAAGVTRIRDGSMSATLIHRDSSRFFSLHHGEAAIHAVRLATAFFGKGQCVPEHYRHSDGQHIWRQTLKGPYYQPLEPSRRVPPNGDAWSLSRTERQASEICTMHYELRLTRTDSGWELDMKADGTHRVPVSVEFNLREGGTMEGVEKVPGQDHAWLMQGGMASYTVGKDRMRFGPGGHENRYVQVRGAMEKLSGPSVYITSFTPFRQTIRFELL
jgi:hypothetical protein